MKKITLLTIMLNCLFATMAQVKIVTDTDSLYLNAVNKISIQSGELPLTELTMQASNGELNGSAGNYTLAVTGQRTAINLTVLHKNEVVASKQIWAVKADDPKAYLACDTLVSSGNISWSRLQLAQAIIAKCNCPYRFKVLDFTVIASRNKQPLWSLPNKGARLNNEIRSRIKQLKAGDVIVIEDLSVKLESENNRRVMSSLIFSVVN